MEVRCAIEDDKELVKKLYGEVFPDSDCYIEYYFKERYKTCNTYVGYDNDNFVGALQLNKYSINVDGQCEDISYFVGISVDATQRNKGYSRELIEKALQELYKRGENVSILMPIDTNIYLRYGFINVFDRYTYTIECSRLRNANVRGITESVNNINDENYKIISRMYNSAMESQKSYVIRDKQYYINRLGELKALDGQMYIINIEGEAKGYFLYAFEDDKAYISEAYFEDLEALDIIFNFIKGKEGIVDNVEVNFLNSNEFEYVADFSNHHTVKKEPFMMARVVNAESIIRQIFLRIVNKNKMTDRDRDLLKKGVIIRVDDNIINENDGYFLVKLDEDRIEISRTATECEDVAVGISELTLIYMSSVEFRYIEKYKRLRINDENVRELLYLLEDNRKNYINDYI